MQKQQAIIYARESKPPLSEQIEQSLTLGFITCGYCGCSLVVFGSD